MSQAFDPRGPLRHVLRDCKHVLLNFHGPVCDFSVASATDVTGWLRGFLTSQGSWAPDAIRDPADPFEILRFIVATRPDLAVRAESGICEHEVRAAAVAQPAPGLRTLLDGPASVSVIGNACPAAIKSYLARRYQRQLYRVQLIIGRIGVELAMLPPSPTPIRQAALLLGLEPAACVVVASTPADIESARLAGARSVGYAPPAAARERLAAAGADVTISRMHELAGCIYRFRGDSP